MSIVEGTSSDDTLPCRHEFSTAKLNAVKALLTDLPSRAPEAVQASGVASSDDWLALLRGAVESLRGTASATTTEKKRFIAATLGHAQTQGFISSWSFIGSDGRQDYRVNLPDGTVVAVEAKGCPDGNNTNIWDRPSWADEFIVWCLCPESLANSPGHGVWSGISTRLLPKVAAERKVVDAFFFWDGRCGTALRRCPKGYGVKGSLRAAATDKVGQDGGEDWMPPPCVYLFPRSAPTIPANTSPPSNTVDTCKFARAMLSAFGVPDSQLASYAHTASIRARGTASGTQIEITTISRNWPDGDDRIRTGNWKPLRREA